MGPAAEAFRSLLRRITPGLQDRGFTKQRSAFSRIVGGNLAAIEFARNPDSTPAHYAFFVDLGVVSRFVHWFETGRIIKTKDIPRDAFGWHWWRRLGELMPDQVTWGWYIEKEDDAAPMAEGLLEAIDHYGLPVLDDHVRDTKLLEVWTRSLESTRSGDIHPLLRLSVLARALGQLDLAERAVAKLREESRGEHWAARVEEHAEKLARWKPPAFR